MRDAAVVKRDAGTGDWLIGGGEMGDLIRAADWPATPLGPLQDWSDSLRTALALCLESPHPALVWWGRDFLVLYNDACRPLIAADRHPHALGRPGGQTCTELWPVIGPKLERAFRHGAAEECEVRLAPLDAEGSHGERYASFTFTPLRNGAGSIDGVFSTVTDITERVLARRRAPALGASEERIRALMQTVSGMTFEADAPRGNAIPSELTFTFTGMSPEQTAGFGWTRAVHPDDVEGAAARWEQAMRDGEPCEMRHRIRAADGSYRWFMLRSMPLRDAEGRIERWVGSLTDIDDLIRAEAQLRRLAQFPEENPNPVLRIGRGGTLLYANAPARAYLAAAGCAADAPLPGALLELAEKACDRTGAVEAELGDGQGLWYWCAAIQPPGENYVNVYGRDITKRRLAEEALRESEERFQLAAEIGRSGTWDWDVPTGSVIWSRGHFEVLGYRVDEVTPSYQAWADRVHPEDRPRVEEEIRRTMAQRREYGCDFRVVWPDKTVHWMSARARFEYGEDGACRRMLGIMADVTEHKLAEQRLRELNEQLTMLLAERTRVAEERAAHLRELAGELTRAEQRERDRLYELLHDHVQPLLVAGRLGLSGLGEHTPIETWMQAAAETNRHITDALDTARSLSVELNPPLVRDKGLAPALQWLARWAATKHGLEVDLRCNPDAEPPDVSIRIMCFKAVRELLMNAVKHAGVKKVTLTVQRGPGETVRIAVADEGHGFDAAASRAAAAATGSSGLWNLERRLGMVGGHLVIDSKRGAGTRVTLLAPMRTVPGSANAADGRSRRPKRTSRQ